MADNVPTTNGLAVSGLTLLEHERANTRAQTAAILELIVNLRAGSRDPRLGRLEELVRDWRQHADELVRLLREEFLDRLQSGSVVIPNTGHRRWEIARSLLAVQPFTAAAGSDALLDALLIQTGAERGFVLFWNPGSGEAEVVAARNYQTKVLSTEEYQFSRALLGSVLGGEAMRLDDATGHAHFKESQSVMDLQIRSVLAVPLTDGNLTIGALYLEHNARPAAFDADDLGLVEDAARMFMFILRLGRFLPAPQPPLQVQLCLDPTRAVADIIGQDPSIQALMAMVRRIADSPAAVLIEGESGTGKDLVARALHIQSRRRDKSFIVVNCAAIPENLLESELFGREKGAYTGATQHIGLVEEADHGTLFFDEIGELALPMQSKLLRFLQSGEFRRLGDTKTRYVDARVVAATSRDLRRMVDDGSFLEALFFRLNVIPVRIPKLSARPADIPLLIEHFRNRFAGIYQRPVTMDPDVIAVLQAYPFPGNVRELENLIERMVALSSDGRICLGDLPREVFRSTATRIPLGLPWPNPIGITSPCSLAEVRRLRAATKSILDDQERRLVTQTVAGCGGNIRQAAMRLGIHWATLYKLLKRRPVETRDAPVPAALPSDRPGS